MPKQPFPTWQPFEAGPPPPAAPDPVHMSVTCTSWSPGGGTPGPAPPAGGSPLRPVSPLLPSDNPSFPFPPSRPRPPTGSRHIDPSGDAPTGPAPFSLPHPVFIVRIAWCIFFRHHKQFQLTDSRACSFTVFFPNKILSGTQE